MGGTGIKLRGWELTLVVALTLGALWPQAAQAYHLGDHKRIALQAVSEINHCYPGLISEFHSFVLWTSDLDEDIDILRKDFVYSHYFNPYKHLNMWRYDSSVRVSRLEKALLEDAAGGDNGGFLVYAHLGHAIHQLQDMTVPAHVVPVAHWLNDGFEKFPFKGDISSGLSCNQLKQLPSATNAAPDLNTLLIRTAKQTLASVAAIRLKILRNNKPEWISGAAFWQESSNNDFGHYGVLGNNYGRSSFVVNGVHYVIPNAQKFYAKFKQQQMKLATRVSAQALYWFLVLHGKGQIKTPPHQRLALQPRDSSTKIRAN